MMRTKSVLIVFAVLAWVTTTPHPAAAEWFAELYGGASFTQSDDITDTSTLPAVIEFKDVDIDTSFLFGGRGGYWFETPLMNENLNFGLAVDASYFQPDIDSQTVNFTVNGVPIGAVVIAAADNSVLPISFDLMLRWQVMKSAEFPKGQVQPYLTAGPAIFIAEFEDTTNFTPPGQSDTDVSVGLKLGAGLSWHFSDNWAVFGEYRFTYFSPEFELQDVTPPPTLETIEADVSTHHVVGGISYRF